MDTLIQWYNAVMSHTGDNQFVGGVLAAFVMGIVGYLMRQVPIWIYRWLSKTFIVSASINNCNGFYQEMQYHEFLRWYSQTRWFKYSKILTIATGWYSKQDGADGNRDDVLMSSYGPGVGVHYFWKGFRLYWFIINRLESGGAERLKEEVIISTFGFTNQNIISLCNGFLVKFNTRDKLHVHRRGKDGWIIDGLLQPRELDTVAVDPETIKSIRDSIDFVINHSDWFIERGLPAKTTIVITGKPGGGKTSLIRALAHTYGRNVANIDPEAMTWGLSQALSSVPRNSFVVIEDFDACQATHKRKSGEKNKIELDRPSDVVLETVRSVETAHDEIMDAFMGKGMNISAILNALDGITTLNNSIIFMTTNHPEDIDPAVIRSGRVDLIVDVAELTHDLITQYICRMFKDDTIPSLPEGVEFSPIMGCDLQALFYAHRFSASNLIDAIPKNVKEIPYDPNKKHPSHVTRSSDASSFDEICVNCGAKDIAGAGWGGLAKPCKKVPKENQAA